MRRTGGVVSALLTMSLLSGCSALVEGWAGVTVDDQGGAVIVVQSCGLPFDWLTLRGTKDGIVGPSEEPTPVGDARWTADPAVEPGSFTQVGTTTSGAPWTLETSPAVFEDGATYSVQAGMDSMWGGANRSYGAVFSRPDLATLRPGQVLNPFGDVLTLEQFQKQACD